MRYWLSVDYRGIYIPISLIIILILAGFAMGSETVTLPAPSLESDFSLEAAIVNRRSVRDFSKGSLTLEELSQLLWACQGISSNTGLRTAPSAGALYPLEVYIIADRVEGLKPGVYHYRPGPGISEHRLDFVSEGISGADLAKAALEQDCIRNAAVNVVLTSVTSRTEAKYGSRSLHYVLLECGHAAQNLCLQVQALELGVVTVGAFYEEKVRALLGIGSTPLYLLAVGRPAR